MSISTDVTAPTTDVESAAEVDPANTAAPRPAGRVGRVLGWVFVVVLLLGLALVSLRFVTTAPSLSGGLNPESPGPAGAKAITELVRQQNVQVEVSRNRISAAASVGGDTTLVLTDPYSLSDDAVRELIGSADRVVLLSSSSRMLNLLDLGTTALTAGESITARCDLAEFSQVGEIQAVRMFTPAAGATACFTNAEGDAAVLRGDYEGTVVTIVEASRLLSNDALAQNGNAALGLALLAQTDHIVWYIPSFGDGDVQGAGQEQLGDFTPGWVTPAILLALFAALAAMLWRGRRFGPLVAETLPVTVRASETMQGRARLTALAADAPHAAAAIRTGTRTRLATRLALSPRATAQEVSDAASDRLQVPRGSLYDLLDGPDPASDRDLIDLARKLSELETAVERTVHTEGNRP